MDCYLDQLSRRENPSRTGACVGLCALGSSLSRDWRALFVFYALFVLRHDRLLEAALQVAAGRHQQCGTVRRGHTGLHRVDRMVDGL